MNRKFSNCKVMLKVIAILGAMVFCRESCAQLSKDNFYAPEGTALFGVNIFKDKYILVPDLVHNTLRILNKDLKEVWKIEELKSPHSVAIFKDQSIYVGGHRSGMIYKFDGNFQRIWQWGHLLREKGLIVCPSNIAVGPEGNIYISDWILHKIIKVNEKGEYLLTFDASPINKGLLSALGKMFKKNPPDLQFIPHGLWVTKDGVYVADQGAGTIQIFTREGEYVTSWPKPNNDFIPWAIRPISPDYFAVPNKSDDMVYIFNKSGKFLKMVDYNEKYPGVKDDPTVNIFDDQGNVIKNIDRGVSGISNLIADQSDNMYLAGYRVGHIKKVNYTDLLQELKLLDQQL